ncbi:hypothetical protein A374_06471 [Fictibacillus macauensis ZFHKF-1]|uniref:Kinase n=1 Tax=Fictibacillus macauensis ZFHKF-1 TaxID=1196324 RepID=I8AK60_9BACL|nr:hypothetical protein [Fictibacillus macauensis]EIT86222.1 hypothetical protein A374_06471 [Fictibacillus macauensis ZFHKF-1]
MPKKLFKKKTITEKDVAKYSVIGDGSDGIVYQISSKKCVKLFFKEETCKLELRGLKAGKSSLALPKLYEYGDNYIVSEYIEGISLARYLKRGYKIDEALTKKILFVLKEFQRIGFTRWDTDARHVLICEKTGGLKIVDHKRAFGKTRRMPIKLMNDLDKLGGVTDFLTHVKKLNPALYPDWSTYYKEQLQPRNMS